MALVEQVRLARARDGQQERDGRRLLHALRRHERRPRRALRRLEDAGLRARAPLPRRGDMIPLRAVERPPSAELRPDQKDEDSLPPYEVLDRDPAPARGGGRAASTSIVAGGEDPATAERVLRMVERSEYKRRQMAPGLKVTAHGLRRRLAHAHRPPHRSPHRVVGTRSRRDLEPSRTFGRQDRVGHALREVVDALEVLEHVPSRVRTRPDGGAPGRRGGPRRVGQRRPPGG